MTYRVGPKGQVVLPKQIRERLGIAPGDEVVVLEGEDEVRIRKARGAARVRGMLAGPDSLTQALEEQRGRDRALEDERDGGHGRAPRP